MKQFKYNKKQKATIDAHNEMMIKKIEWEIMIELKNCTINGKVLSYEMSSDFTKWYLGHKFNLNKGYPEYIIVNGQKEEKKFTRVGMSGNFDLYECGEFQLKIKYSNGKNQ